MRTFPRLISRLFVILALAAPLATRADSFLQLALWPPDLQLVGEDESIKGLRLQIYGRNQSVTGLDLGCVHETMDEFKGLAFGLASLVDGGLRGAQFTWLYSRAGALSTGWQSGLICRADGGLDGLQTGAVNLNQGDTHGLQIAFLYNSVAEHISGLQAGLVNRATSVKGLQIGLINLTEQMQGIQLGLWNQIDARQTWTVIPFINGKF